MWEGRSPSILNARQTCIHRGEKQTYGSHVSFQQIPKEVRGIFSRRYLRTWENGIISWENKRASEKLCFCDLKQTLIHWSCHYVEFLDRSWGRKEGGSPGWWRVFPRACHLQGLQDLTDRHSKHGAARSTRVPTRAGWSGRGGQGTDSEGSVGTGWGLITGSFSFGPDVCLNVWRAV